MWPYEESDHMEIGESGWIPTKNGCFLNIHTKHTIDEIGREFDESGNLIYDPLEDN